MSPVDRQGGEAAVRGDEMPEKERAKVVHGPHCTIGPGGICMSAHCQWCGRPHSMWAPCGCQWSKRQEVAPDVR